MNKILLTIFVFTSARSMLQMNISRAISGYHNKDKYFEVTASIYKDGEGKKISLLKEVKDDIKCQSKNTTKDICTDEKNTVVHVLLFSNKRIEEKHFKSLETKFQTLQEIVIDLSDFCFLDDHLKLKSHKFIKTDKAWTLAYELFCRPVPRGFNSKMTEKSALKILQNEELSKYTVPEFYEIAAFFENCKFGIKDSDKVKERIEIIIKKIVNWSLLFKKPNLQNEKDKEKEEKEEKKKIESQNNTAIQNNFPNSEELENSYLLDDIFEGNMTPEVETQNNPEVQNSSKRNIENKISIDEIKECRMQRFTDEELQYYSNMANEQFLDTNKQQEFILLEKEKANKTDFDLTPEEWKLIFGIEGEPELI
jgi:hypothetical protein